MWVCSNVYFSVCHATQLIECTVQLQQFLSLQGFDAAPARCWVRALSRDGSPPTYHPPCAPSWLSKLLLCSGAGCWGVQDIKKATTSSLLRAWTSFQFLRSFKRHIPIPKRMSFRKSFEGGRGGGHQQCPQKPAPSIEVILKERKDFLKLLGFRVSSSSVPQPSKQPSVQMFAPEIILPVHYLCPACLDRERAGGAWSSLTSPGTQDYPPHFTAEHISLSSNPPPPLPTPTPTALDFQTSNRSFGP